MYIFFIDTECTMKLYNEHYEIYPEFSHFPSNKNPPYIN